jgi:hypothetical protein
MDWGSAVVSTALADVSSASPAFILPTPFGEQAGMTRVFGETPKTAVETTALPEATEWFRLRTPLPRPLPTWWSEGIES